MRGEQESAPLTTLDNELDAGETHFSPESDLADISAVPAENGTTRRKEGCGGPGSMCCCPCGALKSGADGESKIKMEKVRKKGVVSS